jgi:hypothetical protein
MAYRERCCEDGRWMELARLAFVLAVPAEKKVTCSERPKLGWML